MRYRTAFKSDIKADNSYMGESLEDKVRRVVDNKEPIEQISPIIYTDRKDGVLPQYDIRTDRFEIAQDAMSKVAATRVAKRMELIKGGEGENGETTETQSVEVK